jgi:uncharacterized Zn finger protein
MSRRRSRGYDNSFPRYTTVAERKAKAQAAASRLQKKDSGLQPVAINGRLIARSFWGKAWCHHLEQFSDFSNRLPRGRSYVRNGSVVDLKIEKGAINARVAGSSVYDVSISISTLPEERWAFIKQQCAGGIGSALELLQGKISDQVMQTVCHRDNGLFPHPVDIKLDCNCPDWATLCKHLAAVLYGVGARLDESPELLFLLRGVDHAEMIEAELTFDTQANTGSELSGDLSAIFGIEIDSDYSPELKNVKRKKKQSRKKQAVKKAVARRKRTGTRTINSIGSRAALMKKRVSKKRLVKKAVARKGLIVKKRVAKKSNTRRSTSTQSSLSLPSSGISIARGLRASHLKKLRSSYGLTVADLSRLSGVSVATLHRWEKLPGVINTNKKTLKLISRAFDLSQKQVERWLGSRS